MLFLPESPRFLMHQKKRLEAFKVWKRIRDLSLPEAKEEFYVMAVTENQEETQIQEGVKNSRFPFMDFITYVIIPPVPYAHCTKLTTASLVRAEPSFMPTS